MAAFALLGPNKSITNKSTYLSSIREIENRGTKCLKKIVNFTPSVSKYMSKSITSHMSIHNFDG